MKNFTYLILAASLSAATSADAFAHKTSTKGSIIPKRIERKAPERKSLKDIKALSTRAGGDNSIWRAAKETIYGWTGEDWELDNVTSFKHDSQGRVVEEVINSAEYYTRYTYAYDSNGMEVLKLEEVSEDGINYENYGKTEREYDPIVTSLIVKNREYVWDDGEWVLNGNNYNRTVTRDDAGNVTNVEIAVLFEGIFDPTIRINVGYGADGKATSINESVLIYGDYGYYWEEGTSLTNITWEETDGQIVEANIYTQGANRMKTVDQIDEDTEVHAEISYDGNNFTAVLSGIMEGAEMTGISSYEQLDDYGSHRQISDATYAYDEEEVYHEVETYTLRYDSYGNLLESKDVVDYDGEVEVFEDVEGIVEYDETFGYPLVYTILMGYFDDETEEMVKENMMKVDFSDYYDAALKVAGIQTDTNAPAEYYTLQGVKVASPEAGNIYICRKGGKTTKIIAK